MMRLAWLVSLAIGLALGCSADDGSSDDGSSDDGGDGQTGAGDGGKDDGTGSGGGDGAPCIDTEHPVDFDEQTPLGFSASDVVEAVAGPHASQLEWIDSPDYQVEWAGDSVDLTLDVSYDDGELVYVDSQVDPESGYTDEGCTSYLRMGVVIGFATGDGVFAEHWDVTLFVRQLERVSFDHEIDLDAIEGTFSADDIALGEDTELDSLDAGGQFEEGSTKGSIMIRTFSDMGGGQGAMGRGNLACWPGIAGCQDV